MNAIKIITTRHEDWLQVEATCRNYRREDLEEIADECGLTPPRDCDEVGEWCASAYVYCARRSSDPLYAPWFSKAFGRFAAFVSHDSILDTAADSIEEGLLVGAKFTGYLTTSLYPSTVAGWEAP